MAGTEHVPGAVDAWAGWVCSQWWFHIREWKQPSALLWPAPSALSAPPAAGRQSHSSEKPVAAAANPADDADGHVRAAHDDGGVALAARAGMLRVRGHG